MSKPSKFDFTAWLQTKNPNESYNFNDSHGCCLMGQFMTSVGEDWSMSRYNELCNSVLGGRTHVLSGSPQTMGAAFERVKALEDA